MSDSQGNRVSGLPSSSSGRAFNTPIPHASLPSTPLPPHSLPPNTSHLPPNLSTVMGSLNPPSPSTNSKTKDGLIRMLLQSNPVTMSSLNMEEQQQQPSYLNRLCGTDRLLSLIQLDHSYTKPWNWRPESSLCQPTKTLFVPRVTRNISLEQGGDDQAEFVDVVSDPGKPVPPYDPQQACKVMNECERFVFFANPRLGGMGEEEEDDLTNWEEKLNKDGWTSAQSKLIGRVLKVLTQDRLARLALDGVDNEPVQRRIAVDRSARRVRAVLAAPPTSWDRALVCWLHSTLAKVLPRPFLSAWLDIVQTLRSKVPGLVDRMLAGSHDPLPSPGLRLDSRARQVSREGLAVLLKRPWDPAASSLASRRLARLPGGPVLVVAPPGPTDPRVMSRRMRLWNNQLGCLGKVIVINMPAPKDEAAGRTPLTHYLYQMVSATLTKVREIKQGGGAGERPVVLLGWGVGAAIAAHVAGLERLAGLVCLGFPLSTLAGGRGQAGDSLLELKTPVLFVVGERATQSSSDDIEDLRERLPVETGLVIVGGADDDLRLSKRKKKAECVTQCMVDRCIMDEVRDFLVSLLSTRGEAPTFAIPSHESFLNIAGGPGGAGGPRKAVKSRKRSSSTASSEGGPLSPVKKAPRAQGIPAATCQGGLAMKLVPGGGGGGISLTAGPQGTTPIHILPQTAPTAKKARKARKSKSTDSSSDPHSFSVLPVSSLPPSLLSISTPLPQVQGGPQLSPPPLPIRVPSQLPYSPTMSPRPPYSPVARVRPTSPTPRVIQYAGRDRVPKTDPIPIPHNPTTPTWSVAGSRPMTSLLTVSPTQTSGLQVMTQTSSLSPHKTPPIRLTQPNSPEKLYLITVPSKQEAGGGVVRGELGGMVVSPSTQPPREERQDVAQILASLSGIPTLPTNSSTLSTSVATAGTPSEQGPQ